MASMSNQESQTNSIQFITCDVCGGTGQTSNGLVCKNCSGNGLMAYYQSRFYYWNQELSRPIIKLRQLKNSFHLALNLLAYIIGLVGLTVLVYWIYRASFSTADLGAFAFWRVKSVYILIFWISLIADMFVIYRLSEEEAAKQKIKKVKYYNKKL